MKELNRVKVAAVLERRPAGTCILRNAYVYPDHTLLHQVAITLLTKFLSAKSMGHLVVLQLLWMWRGPSDQRVFASLGSKRR